MKKKTYTRPAIKVRALQTRAIMNLDSYRQEPISTDILTTEDATEDYWGY